MIRLTRETDYAIVLLVHLAGSQSAMPPEASLNARALALACRLRPPMVGKILKTLSRTGILTSQRGAKGGYTLARPATQITIAEVVTAMEGPIAITECTNTQESRGCHNEPFCAVRSNWQAINQALLRALADLTLAQMARPLEHSEIVTMSVRKLAMTPCAAPMETA